MAKFMRSMCIHPLRLLKNINISEGARHFREMTSK